MIKHNLVDVPYQKVLFVFVVVKNSIYQFHFLLRYHQSQPKRYFANSEFVFWNELNIIIMYGIFTQEERHMDHFQLYGHHFRCSLLYTIVQLAYTIHLISESLEPNIEDDNHIQHRVPL